MTRMISFFVLVAILVVIGALFFRVISGFLLPLFLALVLVVIFRPLFDRIASRLPGRNRLAAGLTTLAILLIVLMPMVAILGLAATETTGIVRSFDRRSVQTRVGRLRDRFGLDLPSRKVQDTLQSMQEEMSRLSAEGAETKEIRASAGRLRSLSKELETALAAAPEAPTDEERYGIAVGQISLKSLDGDLRELTQLRSSSREFSGKLHEVDDDYLQLRQELLGSGLKLWLKQQANPSKSDWEQLRNKFEGLVGPWALGGAQFAGGFLASMLIGLGVMIVAIYYFLADGPGMIRTFMRLSPLDDRYEAQLIDQFVSVSRAVVVATLLSALVQGMLAGIGYFLVGLDSVFLLAILTMLFALIPFVGAAAVWVPCCLWLLLFEERTTAAVLLALYGAGVISMADNVIKPYVLQGRSNLHPLLALLSVLGGIQAMGPIGILVGPMVVAFVQPLLGMLQTELDALSAK